jgi:hypothetical protein
MGTFPPVPTQRTPIQQATITLIVSRDGLVRTCHAVVTRISPLDIRLAILTPIEATPADIYRWNPLVRVRLNLPEANCEVATRGIITGVMANIDNSNIPFVLDLDFPEITEEEEKALRDSNPLLVVA